MTLSISEFVARWQDSTLTERQGSQSHFTQLCQALGQPPPAEADMSGASYTFERHVSRTAGGKGYADVWMRDRFSWEYKGKHKNLDAAYRQLLDYREDLGNTPLLVVCDFNRFEVHTNFTATDKRVYKFTLADLTSTMPTPTSALPPLEVLRSLFTDPTRLRPDRVAALVTEQAAAKFALLAANLRGRGADPERAAHFLMRLLFCLFAEDVGNLMPDHLFTRLVENTRRAPDDFNAQIRQLFSIMSRGGYFGFVKIPHFNGGLFDDDFALDLEAADLTILAEAAALDWSSIEPGIFGTLFERSLDPSKRSQLGAHYTSTADILLIVEPVLMEPLRRRWAELQEKALELINRRDEEQARINRILASVRGPRPTNPYQKSLEELFSNFLADISRMRVLDPACGSGNFLYVALKRLLDLEKEVITFAVSNGVQAGFPTVEPSQLYGIEINPYAFELASVVVWIGYIQWLNDNGFGVPSSPILKPLHNIKRMDAILAYSAEGKPVEPEWPEADVIIGNPPFLGNKRLRTGLGDKTVEALYELYSNRVSGGADLVTYWFEKARQSIVDGRARRVGLLATQGIRGGANRRVLDRIKGSGDIFLAWSDRPWILDGAMVHVSLIGFDNGSQRERTLDGVTVTNINANLTRNLDITQAQRLPENIGISFMGDTKVGPFDIEEQIALTMLSAIGNPNGRPNSDVVRPWVNGLDITQRPRRMWIIDFGVSMTQDEAALYEAPFEYAKRYIKPFRATAKSGDQTGIPWWLHQRSRPDMRAAIALVNRYIITPRVSKHRLFAWLNPEVLPDSATIAIARDDDYFFGVLHSSLHELWARRTGTQLREAESGFRYTPTTTFETYPFPWPPGHEPEDDPRVEAIAGAARDLVAKRDTWLNPPGAAEADLKRRTLTNLYNERPTWLDLAHKRLDKAVLDAYGWPHDLADDEILERLLALNLERAQGQGIRVASRAEADGGEADEA